LGLIKNRPVNNKKSLQAIDSQALAGIMPATYLRLASQLSLQSE
jgi:hypothetical protein